MNESNIESLVLFPPQVGTATGEHRSGPRFQNLNHTCTITGGCSSGRAAGPARRQETAPLGSRTRLRRRRRHRPPSRGASASALRGCCPAASRWALDPRTIQEEAYTLFTYPILGQQAMPTDPYLATVSNADLHASRTEKLLTPASFGTCTDMRP